MRPRSLLLLALAGPAVLAACGAEQPGSPPAPAPVVVDVGGGAGERVLAGPVEAAVEPGAVVRLRSVHEGPQATSMTHLLTSSPPGEGPPVFSRVAAGALPNAAVWGRCLGGAVTRTSGTCPVPPVEGPRTWDGRDHLSLGAVLGGETRELTLADRLPEGTLRLWCRLHPTLSVTLTVGGSAPAPAAERPADPSPAPRPAAAGEVVVAPGLPDAPGEALVFAPAVTTVPAGGTVTWRTSRPSPHSVEFGQPPELGDTQPADSTPVLPPGGLTPTTPARSGFLSTDPGAPGGTAFRVRFPQPGRFDYACRFHPTMRGSVLVTARPA